MRARAVSDETARGSPADRNLATSGLLSRHNEMIIMVLTSRRIRRLSEKAKSRIAWALFALALLFVIVVVGSVAILVHMGSD
jgi:hypothetical protein